MNAASVLLISTYELGHQPLGLASPAGFLHQAGIEPVLLDLAVEPLDEAAVARARFVGFSTPMHTALRLAVRVAARVRGMNPEAHLCFYGLYAGLNAAFLFEQGADSVIGGEYETALTRLIEAVLRERSPAEGALIRGASPDRSRTEGAVSPQLEASHQDTHRQPDWKAIPGVASRRKPAAPILERLPFVTPARGGLPAPERYARLEIGGEHRLAGYVEASRGCLHLCRHCPLPAVYGGRFFVVPRDVVLEDIDRQVEAGARHITFGDPDFLNGPGHARLLARELAGRHPGLTFDFTAKVEHLLKQRALLPELRAHGALFIVSAIESLSDTVLEHLDKGHTRADVEMLASIMLEAGLTLQPTLLPFTPWTNRRDYLELLEFVAHRGWIEQVAPVQYTLRLLIPPGSRLLELDALQPHLGILDAQRLSWQWRHPDPVMDDLQREVAALVEKGTRAGEGNASLFEQLRALAGRMLEPAVVGLSGRRRIGAAAGPGVSDRGMPKMPGRPASKGPGRPEPAALKPPRLTEDWFC